MSLFDALNADIVAKVAQGVIRLLLVQTKVRFSFKVNLTNVHLFFINNKKFKQSPLPPKISLLNNF